MYGVHTRDVNTGHEAPPTFLQSSDSWLQEICCLLGLLKLFPSFFVNEAFPSKLAVFTCTYCDRGMRYQSCSYGLWGYNEWSFETLGLAAKLSNGYSSFTGHLCLGYFFHESVSGSGYFARLRKS